MLVKKLRKKRAKGFTLGTRCRPRCALQDAGGNNVQYKFNARRAYTSRVGLFAFLHECISKIHWESVAKKKAKIQWEQYRSALLINNQSRGRDSCPRRKFYICDISDVAFS